MKRSRRKVKISNRGNVTTVAIDITNVVRQALKEFKKESK